MKIYAEVTYLEDSSVVFKPVFIEDEEEWKVYARFDSFLNQIKDHCELLDVFGPEKVTLQNEMVLLERAEALSRAFEGKDTLLFR